MTLQEDDSEEDKEERGKEMKGDDLRPGKEEKISRITFRHPGVARPGIELTLPFTRYKAIIRLKPKGTQPPTAFAGNRSP